MPTQPLRNYKNVAPGVDLVLQAAPSGFTKQVILRERPTKAPVWRFPLQATGLTASKLPSGGLAIKDASGRTVFSSDSPS